jgi:hypothetical protein
LANPKGDLGVDGRQCYNDLKEIGCTLDSSDTSKVELGSCEQTKTKTKTKTNSMV